MSDTSLSYVHEKLLATVTTLAEGDGQLRDRLSDAMAQFIGLTDEEFADQAQREKFVGIVSRMTAHQLPNGGGSLSASARDLGTEEAREIVRDILTLYDDVTRRFGHSQER